MDGPQIGLGTGMIALYEDLKRKNVVITGGASGLGLAAARAFAANESTVVIIGRDTKKLQRAVDELGTHTHYIVFDLNNVDHLQELDTRIHDTVGDVHVLVNNAGINLKKEALKVSNKEFSEIIQTNQTAVFALTRELARAMVHRRAGVVIMISSMASQFGIPKVIGYAASKAAVEGMTRALAVEWAPYGVRVNCIAPGFIRTDMSAKALNDDPERKHRVLARTPMGTLGEPLDVANAALFLASQQSQFITGVTLPVDGGYSIGF